MSVRMRNGKEEDGGKVEVEEKDEKVDEKVKTVKKNKTNENADKRRKQQSKIRKENMDLNIKVSKRGNGK